MAVLVSPPLSVYQWNILVPRNIKTPPRCIWWLQIELLVFVFGSFQLGLPRKAPQTSWKVIANGAGELGVLPSFRHAMHLGVIFCKFCNQKGFFRSPFLCISCIYKMSKPLPVAKGWQLQWEGVLTFHTSIVKRQWEGVLKYGFYASFLNSNFFVYFSSFVSCGTPKNNHTYHLPITWISKSLQKQTNHLFWNGKGFWRFVPLY